MSDEDEQSQSYIVAGAEARQRRERKYTDEEREICKRTKHHTCELLLKKVDRQMKIIEPLLR